MLTVVTSCHPAYSRAWVFPSLAALSCRVVCLLEPGDDRPLPANAERVTTPPLGRCYQEGSFLSHVPGVADNDVVVLADADAVFQRDWSAEEAETLANLGAAFALGYNMRPGQRGAEEFIELRPRRLMADVAKLLGVPALDMAGCLVYNTGLMAAHPPAWWLLTQAYRKVIGAAGPGLFALNSWQQYFVCLTLHRWGWPVVELGYETHSHGHFRLTPAHAIIGGRLCYSGRPVLYAHNIQAVVPA